jgi:mono/diheme cytochrome c family protein
VQLGLDIDAEHAAGVLPLLTPSAERGAGYVPELPAQYLGREVYLTHAPVDLWHALRSETVLRRLSDQMIWDVTAWVWQSNTTPQELAEGQQLYATNCAACHGEQGRGDGVFAAELDQADTNEHSGIESGEMTTRPTDFTDAVHMLATSPAHLQGKMLRGGMGTGMPYWGPIFTEEQTWVLVAYLWKFQFEMENP